MTRTLAVVVFPGVQSLDVTGPMDVFAEANSFLPPDAQYRLEVIGVEHGWLACSNGLAIQAHGISARLRSVTICCCAPAGRACRGWNSVTPFMPGCVGPAPVPSASVRFATAPSCWPGPDCSTGAR